MEIIEEQLDTVQNYLYSWLCELSISDANSNNRLTTTEHYTRRAVYTAFEKLHELNIEPQCYNESAPFPSFMRWLDDHEHNRIRLLVLDAVLCIYAIWIGIRCNAWRVRRIRKGVWSITLENHTWYLNDPYFTYLKISPYTLDRGAANWEMVIYGKCFCRNLKTIDSLMPWLNQTIFDIKKQANIYKTVKSIQEASAPYIKFDEVGK